LREILSPKLIEGHIMKLPQRRQFLHLAAGAAALPAASRIARGQAYPTRPVRIVVGFAAGGPNDFAARLMGQWLSERLGQSFVVENRPGAGGNLGTEAVVRAPGDGQTLLLVSPSHAINATLYDKVGYNFIRDIVPVSSIYFGANVMAVHPSAPFKTLPEFVAYAKASPRKISFGSGGNGSIQHLASVLFQMTSGVDLVHVPYRGEGPALTDLLGGQIQVVFGTLTTTIEYLKGGKLRALAVTTRMRSDAVPDIPTVDEFVPGYEVSSWVGIGAPRNTPAEIVERLNLEINAGLADPKIKARLAEVGRAVLPGSPADFGRLVADETEKWGKVIRAASIKPD
jgi:tripartite-type tricarboxylate transporter receptor subunit TctC